jgi:Family of unknown function (DUF5654)
LSGEILDKFSQLITTALGLVAALAWNDAIQTLFQQFLGTAGGALAAKIFYAVLVTIVVIRRFQNTNTSELRFHALLTDGGREVRFERVAG